MHPLEILQGYRLGGHRARIAVADGQAKSISSANLTEYAMTLNIGTRLLVHGGRCLCRSRRTWSNWWSRECLSQYSSEPRIKETH
jgi:hypothetical protein